jgi:hypothetical protein
MEGEWRSGGVGGLAVDGFAMELCVGGFVVVDDVFD